MSISRITSLCCSILLLPMICKSSVLASAMEVTSLRCEYRTNPQGIDEAVPRLSWRIESDQRGVKQTACQILVATSEALLAQDKGDCWDSGRMETSQSVHVEYAGSPLVSRQACFWKVRVYDQDGKVSAWSRPAWWTMGLMRPDDWKAQWIGREGTTPEKLMDGCAWLGMPGGKGAVQSPAGEAFYRHVFNVDDPRDIISAELTMVADGELICWVNGQQTLTGKGFRVPSHRDVVSLLQAGTNVLSVKLINTTSKPKPAGWAARLQMNFQGGETRLVATGDAWLVNETEADGWRDLSFKDSTCKQADVLGAVGMKPWGPVVMPSRSLPAYMLRKEFVAREHIKRATLYVSGLGTSELHLNGKKVGDAVLSPGVSDYTHRVFYVTHDVTRQIQPGANAVGALLGTGYYYPPHRSSVIFGVPRLMLQLEIDYEDGTRDTVVSDGSWNFSANGPIVANNEYDGETYDARREMPGWASAGFPAADWVPAEVVKTPGGILRAQMIEPIRVTGTIKPVKMTEPRPGVFVFDMGQNMVGWCRLRVRGPAGTVIKLRHAELLKPDGNLYLDNLRGAMATDLYTLKGSGDEVYEPRFTYHGFRFVEMTGFPGTPSLDVLEGQVVNDDLESTGTFACSKSMINNIYRMALWGARGNYRSMPTDCPQRDERQGWLGDRSAESRGESYFFHVAAFYTKWLNDMRDSQLESGSISDVCPAYWRRYQDNVTWPSTAVIIPGVLYDQYGDLRVIERHYPVMEKWIHRMSGYVTNGIIAADRYGDWCVPPEDPKLIHSKDPARITSKEMLATTYFYHDLMLMARYAILLDKPEDAARYREQALILKDALNSQLYKPEPGCYDNGTQTSSVLPLAFDMVPPAEHEKVFGNLVRKIMEESQGHVGTGLIGGQWLNRVLTDGGRADIPYGFATHSDYPSWGYMFKKGATTVWELWNGDTADPAMNSANHVMLLGDLITWFYESLAGIAPDPDNPGFKHIIMKPIPVGDLSFVKASHRSPYGLIISEWSLNNGCFDWNITVPPNSTATVYVPTANAEDVTEDGKSLSSIQGVKLIHAENGSVALDIESGSYRFISKNVHPMTIHQNNMRQ